ncbi:cytochrome c nitrite reductase pentaheme subunit [bacterium BMS3Abin02]|nr:cytochrome c nitrite reductase pentaheme subunit [bacterium BMS3Abin02]HDK45054.1 cytochrome C [Actinomycetota bacterium]
MRRGDGTRMHRFGRIAVLGALIIGATILIAGQSRASAQTDPRWDNSYCLSCHEGSTAEISLPSGETLGVAVDGDAYADSVHGKLDVACVLCHTAITTYPHDPITAKSRRDFTVQMYTACLTCHYPEYTQTRDSDHERARADGVMEAAVCTDCHGSHDVQPPGKPRTSIPLMCRKCHSEIYDAYEESVHGEALTTGNPDVPTCTDCHGVHDVKGPHVNSPFRLFSPQICAACHADKALMDKYDISTNVFSSYLSDFHGTTVVLFEKLAPGQQTNKPVCVDCHGVHDIKAPADVDSSVYKKNLLATCRRCHPDATTNFPDAWLSHYAPSPTEAPLVYWVNTFYKILIPTVIGAMLLAVLLDVRRRLAARLRGRRRG